MDFDFTDIERVRGASAALQRRLLRANSSETALKLLRYWRITVARLFRSEGYQLTPQRFVYARNCQPAGWQLPEARPARQCYLRHLCPWCWARSTTRQIWPWLHQLGYATPSASHWQFALYTTGGRLPGFEHDQLHRASRQLGHALYNSARRNLAGRVRAAAGLYIIYPWHEHVFWRQRWLVLLPSTEAVAGEPTLRTRLDNPGGVFKVLARLLAYPRGALLCRDDAFKTNLLQALRRQRQLRTYGPNWHAGDPQPPDPH